MCTGISLCACLPPGNDVKYSAIVKAFERNSRDYLFTRRPFPIFILSQPSSSSSSSFFLSPVLGSKKYVALLTIRPLRRVSVSAFEGFQGYFAMGSPLYVVFLSFPFFYCSPPSHVTRGKLSLTHSRIKLFYSFSSVFFFLFFPLSREEIHERRYTQLHFRKWVSCAHLTYRLYEFYRLFSTGN